MTYSKKIFIGFFAVVLVFAHTTNAQAHHKQYSNRYGQYPSGYNYYQPQNYQYEYQRPQPVRTSTSWYFQDTNQTIGSQMNYMNGYNPLTYTPPINPLTYSPYTF